jgi:hypothetical protein
MGRSRTRGTNELVKQFKWLLVQKALTKIHNKLPQSLRLLCCGLLQPVDVPRSVISLLPPAVQHGNQPEVL